ncbi:hypothetical protein A2U01_0056925, partial [Trifolium medium]|nr:hypothetical protein [Trifolium medium]
KTDRKLMEKLVLSNEGRETDFKVDENGIIRYRGRVCVPDVPELKKMILEEGHRSGLSIHPGVTKINQRLNIKSHLGCYNHYSYRNGNGIVLLWILWENYRER